MFGDVGFGELLGLGILALLLVGPDRLPTVALEAANMIKKFRKYATSATDQIKDSLGPGYENLKPQDLHPKNFIKKQINEAMVDQPKKLNAKVKLDPDML
jgi:sec-independent protein translocase protein TatB